MKNPRRTLPLACVWTCVACVPIFLAVIICIIGVVPWFGLEGFVEQVLTGDPKADHIMSTFAEILFGRPTAILVTVVVMCTIFGSCLALLLVYTYIPYSAARDGYFYEWFGHEHSTKKGLADYSLLVLGGLTIPLCFVDLGVLIEGMLTTRLVVQFIAQAIGAVILRWKAPNAVRKYEVGQHEPHRLLTPLPLPPSAFRPLPSNHTRPRLPLAPCRPGVFISPLSLLTHHSPQRRCHSSPFQ